MVRSDKKHTIQTRLTHPEIIVLNRFKLMKDFKSTLEAVNYCITRGLEDGLETFIDDSEINTIKSRKISDTDTILVNGRVNRNLYDVFRHVQAEFNLNQRQLLYILIKRIIERSNLKYEN